MWDSQPDKWKGFLFERRPARFRAVTRLNNRFQRRESKRSGQNLLLPVLACKRKQQRHYFSFFFVAYFCCRKLQIHGNCSEHFVCDYTGKKKGSTQAVYRHTHTRTRAHAIRGGQLSLQDVESASGTRVRGPVACLCTLDGRRVPSQRGNKISKNK